MLKQYRYQNNLLTAYRKAMSLFLFAFLPVGVFTALTVFVCLQRYQQRTAKAYVFHTGGASIEIYEPDGPQQQAGRIVLTDTKKRRAESPRRVSVSNP